MKNQGLEIELQNPSNSIPVINQNMETHQSEVIVHKIEDYEAIRGLYPFEIFIKEKLPSLDTKLQKEYSKALDIAGNIAPLSYFLYMNSYLSPQTMKSFVATWKKCYIKYREFNLEILNLFLLRKIWNNLRQKRHWLRSGNNGKEFDIFHLASLKTIFPLSSFQVLRKLQN